MYGYELDAVGCAGVRVAVREERDVREVVAEAALLAAGLISEVLDGVKVLGDGEISKKLTVKASVFSESAKEKIEAVGGKSEVI
mgnify:CR=1 FL=1